ncbi:MAG: hypothetical protein JST96_17665, partial [Bacteroidetes bacterium]|nr:hypothetical protein [Bacteroidota bacterium]
TLVFSTFTGSSSDNWGFTATYGPDGSFYAGGIVGGNGFHTTTGAFQTNFKNGTWDVGIMKFSSGTGPGNVQKIYATYLGGSNNEYPHSLVVDAQGELVVFGRTSSSDFPALTTIGPGGSSTTPAGRNIYVTKFNASGGGLIGSILIGGSGDDGVNIEDQDETVTNTNNTIHTQSLIRNYGDWSRGEVILDGSGNIFVASCTQSQDFPIIGTAFQSTFGGGPTKQDGVVLKINPGCNSVLFSSFLGGTRDDVALVLDQDPVSGDIYVGGATASKDLPGTSAGVYQPSIGSDSIGGFLCRISQDGSTLKATTYLATNGNKAATSIYGVKFDRFGFPYVMGTTTGTWPTKLLHPTDFINAGAKQFITKLQPDLSAVIYSTTFGTNAGMPNISPVAFLVDRCQNVYVSGWGSFYELSTGPDPYNLAGTKGMPVTSNALKSTTDGRDFYFIVIQRDAASLLYATFFGEDDNGNSCCSEHVDGGTSRFDKNGVIYQAICANCFG